jgi:hypothetical protein
MRCDMMDTIRPDKKWFKKKNLGKDDFEFEYTDGDGTVNLQFTFEQVTTDENEDLKEKYIPPVEDIKDIKMSNMLEYNKRFLTKTVPELDMEDVENIRNNKPGLYDQLLAKGFEFSNLGPASSSKSKNEEGPESQSDTDEPE